MLARIWLSGILLASACAAAFAAPPVVRLGRVSSPTPDHPGSGMEALARYLHTRIPAYEFQPVAFRTSDDLIAAASRGELEFAFLSPSLAIQVGVQQAAAPIATSRRSPVPGIVTPYLASAVFVRQDRTAIRTLNDVLPFRVAAADPKLLGGWIAAVYEVQVSGLDPAPLWQHARFLNSRYSIVEAVRNGDADAGILATGNLESLAAEGKVKPGEFRVLPPPIPSLELDHYPLLASTRLYPESPMVRFRHTPEPLAEQVALTLLQMPPGSEAGRPMEVFSWTVPASYERVDTVLQQLRLPPYEDYGRVSLRGLLRLYWHRIAFALMLALAAGVVIALFLLRAAARSRRSLESELAQRHRAEDQLRYRSQLLDQVSDAVLGAGLDQCVTYWNRSAEMTFGWRADEVKGRKLEDVLSLAPVSLPLDGIRREVDLRGLWAGPAMIFNRQGTLVWCEMAVTILTDQSGKRTGSVAAIRDVSARKRAELAIQSIVQITSAVTGEPFFRLLTGELALALEMRYCFVGELRNGGRRIGTIAFHRDGACADNFEYDLAATPCEGVVGQSACFFPSGVQARFPQDEGLAAMSVEAYLGVPLMSSAGDPLGLLVAMHDKAISDLELPKSLLTIFASRASAELERLRTEDALRESEERFRLIEETVTDVFWMNKPGGGPPLYISPSFDSIWGRPRESMIGNPRLRAESIHPDDRERVSRFLSNAAGFDVEYRILTPSGVVRWIHDRGFPARGPDGIIVGVATDITKEKLLEAQLLQAHKMEAVGLLAGGVAHDFNNLLTVINGYSQLIQNGSDTPAPVRDKAAEILKAGERAADLTRQLLAFSRKQVLQPKVLDLNHVIRDIESILRHVLTERAELVCDLSPDIGLIEADPGQLHQVVMNLAVNARDAMPAGGRVILETRNATLDATYAATVPEVIPGDYVLLSVSDSGEGMDADTRQRIFEPFFTTKEHGRGTGLGLSTVYGIVKQSGGHINVYSEPGRGTVFHVYLPRSLGSVQESAAADFAAPQGSETILLVEDQADVRKLAAESLRAFGYRVLEAPDGAEAVRLCAAYDEPIHLVLTDVVMPVMTGPQLARCVLQTRPRVRVLYMSGYTANVIVHQGVLDDGVTLLQKPFTPELLARKVRETLDAPA